MSSALVGNSRFELPVLVFELMQAPQLRYLQAAVLVAPVVEHRVRDAVAGGTAQLPSCLLRPPSGW